MGKSIMIAGACLVILAGSAQAGQPPLATASSEGVKTVEGVVVNGAQPAARSEIDRKSYSLATDLQATTGTVADALRNVPGLEVDAQGALTLRGQPVTVMVDGKPSGRFRGDAGAQALQAAPADQYERVEVIPNPPAELRPDGQGGIVNLITRKNRKPGYSGSLKANLGSEGRYNGSLSGGYNSPRLTLSGDASVRDDPQKFVFTRDRTFFDPVSPIAASRQVNPNVGDGLTVSANGSADYDLDARDRLSAQLSYFDMRIRDAAFIDFLALDAAGAPISGFDQAGRFDLNVGVWTGQASWRRTFDGDGHDLTFSLSQERDLQHQSSPDVLSPQLPPAAALYETNVFRGTTDETNLKADYNRPLPHAAKLKAGYEFDLLTDAYDNFGAHGPSAAGEIIDPARTNRFTYSQMINAAYASYERPFGDLTLLAGLRLERVDIDVNQVTSALTGSNAYSRAYPSLHLTYRLGDDETLSASYGRRVQRPSQFDLNPYRIYLDPYNYRQGDPELKPQTTDSYELGYEQRRQDSTREATLYYRQTRDAFSYLVQDLGAGVLLTRSSNLGSSRTGGLQLVASGKLGRRLRYNISGNGYWTEIDAGGLGLGGRRSGWTGSGRASLDWRPTAKDVVQVTGNLSGKRWSAQGYSWSYGQLNLGYEHRFDARLSTVITCRDVLNTSKVRFVAETPAFQDRRLVEPNTRAVFVGLIYSFGGQGKRPREPEFDFSGGEAGGAPP